MEQEAKPQSGALWRGVMVGVVALLVIMAVPRLGAGLVLSEIAYFSWLARRTGWSRLWSRLLTAALVTGVTFVLVTLVLALTTCA